MCPAVVNTLGGLGVFNNPPTPPARRQRGLYIPISLLEGVVRNLSSYLRPRSCFQGYRRPPRWPSRDDIKYKTQSKVIFVFQKLNESEMINFQRNDRATFCDFVLQAEIHTHISKVCVDLTYYEISTWVKNTYLIVVTWSTSGTVRSNRPT